MLFLILFIGFWGILAILVIGRSREYRAQSTKNAASSDCNCSGGKAKPSSIKGGATCNGPPSRGLKQISRRLAPPMDLDRMSVDFDRMFELAQGSTAAMQDFLDYCEAKPVISMLAGSFDASREDFRQLYSELHTAGVGAWAGGHWVPASALVYLETLGPLLALRLLRNREAMSSGAYKDELMHLAFAIEEYFRHPHVNRGEFFQSKQMIRALTQTEE